MAGIGFELRKLLKRDSYIGLFQAYAYASIIGAGPWVLSIVGILIIGVLSISVVVPEYMITQFQTSVTYLIAGSLIVTGPIQLAFTRFIADRLYEKTESRVLPNFIGVMLLVTVVCGMLGLALIAFAFQGLNNLYRLLMLTGFVLLANIWVATIFLSGLKQYRSIVGLYALGYGITVAARAAPAWAGGIAAGLRARPGGAAARHGAHRAARLPGDRLHCLRLLAAGRDAALDHGGGVHLQPRHLAGQVHLLVRGRHRPAGHWAAARLHHL
jgi:hypothetical protein